MQRRIALISVSLPVWLFFSCARAPDSSSTHSPENSTQANKVEAELGAVLEEGVQRYKAGDLAGAQQLWHKVAEKAAEQGHSELAIRAWNNVAGAHFRSLEYHLALRGFLQARRLVEASGNACGFPHLFVNLASLYLQLGELDAAVGSAKEALKRYECVPEPPAEYAQVLLLMGRLEYYRGNGAQGTHWVQQAIAESNRQEQPFIVAQARENLIRHQLEEGQLAEAGAQLKQLEQVYRRLPGRNVRFGPYLRGKLLRLQGNYTAALAEFRHAEKAAITERYLAALPLIFFERGEALRGMGKLRQAKSCFLQAYALAKEIRLQTMWVGADALRVGTENQVQRLFLAPLVDLIAGIAVAEGRREAARESFELAEENRAFSLHQLLEQRSQILAKLPASYWRDLNSLRMRQWELLREDRPEIRRALAQLHTRLLQAEAEAGLLTPGMRGNNGDTAPGGLARRVQQRLAPGEALVSFSVGEQRSFVWVVTPRTIRIAPLAGRKALKQRVESFVQLVRQRSSAEVAREGEQLFQELVGDALRGLEPAEHWYLSLDDPLYSLPWSALAVREAEQRVFLVERVSLTVLPGAWSLLASLPPAPPSRRFVGIGDPIYNRADQRLRKGFSLRLPWQKEAVAAAPLTLARLVGSGREVELCARQWGIGEAEILTGADASLEKVRRALEDRPAAVAHFATHVLEVPQPPHYGVIALSLNAQGNLEILTPPDVSRWKTPVGLVTLSGCASGMADTLPATGLFGMTRAWIAAGAKGVVASLWPTPDSSGELFRYLYKTLNSMPPERASRRYARALQAAQIQMLRSGGERARPAFWAAYFLTGRD